MSCLAHPQSVVAVPLAPKFIPSSSRLYVTSSGSSRPHALSAASQRQNLRISPARRWQSRPAAVAEEISPETVHTSTDEVLRSLSANGEVSVMVAVGRELVQEVRMLLMSKFTSSFCTCHALLSQSTSPQEFKGMFRPEYNNLNSVIRQCARFIDPFRPHFCSNGALHSLHWHS